MPGREVDTYLVRILGEDNRVAQAVTPASFASALLKRLGIHQTPGAIQALVGWQAAEGGNWHNAAKYNPLNTTLNLPGSGDTGSQGNISVYKDWNQGLEATARTLANYSGIKKALASGNPNAVASAIGSSPWGTSGPSVARAIASTPVVRGAHPFEAATAGGGGVDTTLTAPGTPTPASDTNGVDAAVALLQAQAQQKPQIQSAGIQAPSFSARPALPQGYAPPQGGGGPAPAPDVSALLSAVAQAPQTSVPGASVSESGQITVGGRAATGQAGDLAAAATQRANAINAQHLPYVWGGGHAGQTPLSKAVPLDCSGAVSKVLGINPRVASQFEGWGRPGDGGSHGVTVYAKDTHVLMKINGHFFGTSASNPQGGAGWIKQGDISPAYLKGFTVRHSNR